MSKRSPRIPVWKGQNLKVSGTNFFPVDGSKAFRTYTRLFRFFLILASLLSFPFPGQSPLLFIAQLPNTVHSEQLFAQLVHAISSRSWLFRYGRVRMIFIGGEHLACVSFQKIYLRWDKSLIETRSKQSEVYQFLSFNRALFPDNSIPFSFLSS